MKRKRDDADRFIAKARKAKNSKARSTGKSGKTDKRAARILDPQSYPSKGGDANQGATNQPPSLGGTTNGGCSKRSRNKGPRLSVDLDSENDQESASEFSSIPTSERHIKGSHSYEGSYTQTCQNEIKDDPSSTIPINPLLLNDSNRGLLSRYNRDPLPEGTIINESHEDVDESENLPIGSHKGLFQDKDHLRRDARSAAQLISLGVISTQKAEQLLKKGLDMAEKAADGGKARAYASLMKVAIAAARLEVDHRKLDRQEIHEHKHLHITTEGPNSRSDKILAICDAALQRARETGTLPAPSTPDSAQH